MRDMDDRAESFLARISFNFIRTFCFCLVFLSVVNKSVERLRQQIDVRRPQWPLPEDNNNILMKMFVTPRERWAWAQVRN